MEGSWWTAPGWSLPLTVLPGSCISVFCSYKSKIFDLSVVFELYSFYCSDLCSSRSESYWTAVVGEFDITKTDPDEQLLKVNRIIPHPKVTIQSVD